MSDDLDELEQFLHYLQQSRASETDPLRCRMLDRQISDTQMRIEQAQRAAASPSQAPAAPTADSPIPNAAASVARPPSVHSNQPHSQPLPNMSSGSVAMSGDAHTYGPVIGHNDGNVEVNQTFAAPTGRPPQALLVEYHERLAENANRMRLGSDTVAHKQDQMQLAQVFTMLRAEYTRDLDRTAERSMGHMATLQRHSGDVLALLAEARHQHAVLLGAPGGGKSTVVSYLAAAQATALLKPAQAATLEQQGWPHTQLRPVRVLLKHVLPAGDTLEPLWDVVTELRLTSSADPRSPEAQVRATEQRRLRTALEELLRLGEGLLLLDGLDEVPAERLPGVKALILRACERFKASRILVTCRVYDYGLPAPDRRIGGWPTLELRPFELAAQQTYVRRFYDHVQSVEGVSASDTVTVEQKCERLLSELERNATLRDLTTSPLLLALTVYINKEHATLPNSRGKLLAVCVEELLKRRAHDGVGNTLPLEELWPLVAELAYQAHLGEAAATETNPWLGLPEHTVDQVLRTFYRRQLQARTPAQCAAADQRAITAKQRLLNSSGLFHESARPQQHTPAAAELTEQLHFDFPHRLFQEFLAGYYLLRGEKLKLCLEYAHAEHWRVSLDLLANYAPERSPSFLFRLVEKLLAGDPAAQIRGAELLHAFTKPAVLAHEQPELWQAATTQMLALSGIAPQPATPALEPAQRLQAGVVLGHLGDPRLEAPLTERLVHLPAGTFDLENDVGERRTVTLPAFWMSRYLITNAEYQEFIDAGGYTQERWWPDADGRRWLCSELGIEELVSILLNWGLDVDNAYFYAEVCAKSRIQPYWWHEARLNLPNQPVVGINWWEARAFCAYLNQRYADWLAAHAPGMLFRLPSDFEWERAARNGDSREYPWGADDAHIMINIADLILEQPSPVGMFPLSAWPGGPHDLAGNVWEWTESVYVNYIDTDDSERRKNILQQPISIRGGAWGYPRSSARCAFRFFDHPFYSNSSLGLRVVIASVV